MTTMNISRQLTDKNNNSFVALNETDEAGQIIPLLSFNTYTIFLMVNGFGLTASFSVLGIFSNILNIIVYIKLGLRETTNISFFALAIVDWLLSVCLCLSAATRLSDISPYGAAIINLGYHVSMFMFPCTGVGAWIIFLLSAERCLCIVMPLKVSSPIIQNCLYILKPLNGCRLLFQIICLC